MRPPIPRLTDDHLTPRGRQAWREYNAPGAPVAAGSVLRRFAESARRHGERPAVADESRQLRYHELDDRSDRVAAALTARGVTAGDFVGLLDGRCVETYVGLLGVLKAGAAYVPLNPADPPARLASIVDDCSLATVVSPGPHALPQRPPDGKPLPTADVAELSAPGFDVVPDDPERPAYVIHTSGSMGKPKGVRVRHHSLANLVNWAGERCPAGPEDTVAQTARLFFDPSVQQIFPAWAAGACLVPVPVDVLLEPLRMIEWLARRQITHLDMSTPHWAGMTAAVEMSAALLPLELPDLRWVIVGGDSMRYEHVARWHRVIGGPGRLINVYGPTEATVNATECSPYPGKTAGTVPIGRPLPNYELFLVDESGALCAPHSLGEIHIAGVGVAGGYTDPCATEAAFLPDLRPGARPGDRIYRTGDLGRLVRGGHGEWEIAFAGRRDAYVKVSGYRVDPAEVESAVLHCPGVVDCAVVLTGSAETGTLLCLYVADADTEPELRGRLAEILPRYMIPARFRRVARLDYTLSGKLDRAGMATTYAPRDDTRPAAAPATGLEAMLGELWSTTLGVPDVDPGDSFFSAGGSSLIALGLIAKVKARFGVDVRMMDLYRHPDLTGFATLVADRLATVGAGPEAVSGDVGPQTAYPLSDVDATDIRDRLRQLSSGSRTGETFDCLGGWTGEAAPVGSVMVSVPVRDVSDDAVAAAVGDLVTAHSLLRTTVRTAPNGAVHQVHAVAPFSVPVVGLADGMREVLGGVAAMPWDVADELPFRVVLVRDDDGAGHVVLWVSHTVADGESQAILSGDLRRAVTARATGTIASLADTAPRYRRHVTLLRASAEALADEVSTRESFRRLVPVASARLRERLAPADPGYRREALAAHGDVADALGDVLSALADVLGLDTLPLLVDFHGRTTPDSAGVVGNLATYLPVVLRIAVGNAIGVAAEVRDALDGLKNRHAAHTRLGVAEFDTPEFVRVSVFEETARSSRDIGIADPGPVYGGHVDVTLSWSAAGMALELSGPYDTAAVWSAMRERSAA